LATNAKMTKETDNIEKEVENIEYLMNYINETTKVTKATNFDDPTSVSYANAKHCALLIGVLLHMDRHPITSKALHQDLTSMVKSIEGDVDFLNKHWKFVVEKGGKVASLLFNREIFVQALRINEIRGILISLIEIKLGEIKIEISKKKALERQGKKLRELVDKQKKESGKKIAQYVS